MEQLLAICRLLRPHSHFKRNTSLTLRMDNLFFDIRASFIRLKKTQNTKGYLAPRLTYIRWPDYRGTGGRFPVESVDALAWNQWPEWRGIRSR
jgi:hypothetical protein